jgi:hypothetical protein
LGWFQELKGTGSDGKTELMRPQASKGIFFMVRRLEFLAPEYRALKKIQLQVL